jgi:NTE family protein
MAEEFERLLSESDVLGDLGTDGLKLLADVMQRRSLLGGDTLFEAGDPPDGMVVVERGRLGVVDEANRTIAALGAGAVLGEMGALAGLPRTHTVVALRDTEIRVVNQADFDELFTRHPALARGLSRLVVTRLRSETDGNAKSAPSTVAVLSLDSATAADEVVAALETVARSCAVARADTVEGLTSAEVAALLDRLEADNDVLVLVGGKAGENGDWQRWCLRQADAVVLVVGGGVPNPKNSGQDFLSDRSTWRATVELVVMNPAEASLGHDASAWTALLQPDRLHQVRTADRETSSRFARLVLGRGTGLVFSGGAAKGLAHLGAWRGLQELEVPIDTVAGVSLGSLIGAGVALDYTPDELNEEVAEKLVRQRGLVDFTLPWVSLLQGQGVSRRIQEVGRDRRFEQTWRSFVCTSCDLTTGELVEHRTGLLWKAVRASLSIPGLLPPVREGDRLLVDGALLDNLPVAALRAGHPGPLRVIAIDVGKDGTVDAGGMPEGGQQSGWRLMFDRLHPRRSVADIPSIAQLLMRVMELAGSEGRVPPEATIRPDLEGMGLSDFTHIDRFEKAGYEAVIKALG